MRKQDIPQPSATTFKQCQDFIRDYRLSQWRATAYLKAIHALPLLGTMPTDVAIARHLSDKRAPTAVQRAVATLIDAGLVAVTQETQAGKAYRLTEKGEQACLRVRQIEASWLKLWEDKLDPPQPDYSKAFERLNRNIKALEETVASQRQALDYQASIMKSQAAELASFRGSTKVVSKFGSGSKIPCPGLDINA